MFGSGGKKLVVDAGLHQKVTVAAGILGCTVEEFVAKALEREAERVISSTGSQGGASGTPSAAEVDEIANSLKGLGYLE